MLTEAKQITIARKGRHYVVPQTGDIYPSVTTILQAIAKPALIHWAANQERELAIETAANLYEDLPIAGPKMSRPGYISTFQQRMGKEKAHQKKLRQAADIGSQAHALIEWRLRRELKQQVGAEPRAIDKALWAFMAWEDWRATANLVPLSIEQTIWSEHHAYAGTMDLLAELDLPNGKRGKAIVDWKTGKAIYAEALLQCSAYANAVLEMGHADHGLWGLIVRLPKTETDPEFETRFVSPSEISTLHQVFLSVMKLWHWMNDDKKDSKS